MERLKEKTFFISSRWRNKDQIIEFTQKLRALKVSVLSFLEYHPNKEHVTLDPEFVMRQFESRSVEDPIVSDLSKLDREHIQKADAVALLLPAGNSAHWEAGFAYGLGKICILIGVPEKMDTIYSTFAYRLPT